MFRDLKEYQEIAKIYAEKVSKPEDLDENRNTKGSELAAKRLAEKPKTRAEVGLPPKRQNFDKRREARGSSYRGRPEPKYKPEKGVVFGQRTNEVGAQGGGKPSSGDLSMFKDKKKPKMGSPDSKFIKKDKGVGFVKRGTPMAQRAENKEKNKMRAQEMARQRIAAKKEGTSSTPMSGKERAQAMAKARLAKKAEMAKEDYTPYDIVLDYLIASEQAATIEEANYIMTEMDAETIQSIVAE
jgi:hypothetical protein